MVELESREAASWRLPTLDLKPSRAHAPPGDLRSAHIATPAKAGYPSRIGSVDLARGVLILLMTSTHALTMAEVAPESLWNVWLPRGWATVCFIILSGFVLAATITKTGNSRATRQKLRSRAFHLFVIMVASTAAFEGLKLMAADSSATLGDLSWWSGLLTFDTPYGLSGVLLPVVVLSLVAPGLFALHKKYGANVFLGIAVISALAFWSIYNTPAPTAYSHLANLLSYRGAWPYPVLPFLTLGMVGFALGLVPAVSDGRSVHLKCAAAVGMFGLAKLLIAMQVAPAFPWVAVIAPSQFLIVLYAALWAAQYIDMPMIGVCGQYPLFCFLAHRFVMQGLRVLIEPFDTGGSALYLTYFVGTMALLWAFCQTRANNRTVDRHLRSLSI